MQDMESRDPLDVKRGGSVACGGKPGGRGGGKQYGHPQGSRRVFGYNVREAQARSSNTTVRELMGHDACTEAILSFLRGTDIEKVKSGVLDGT